MFDCSERSRREQNAVGRKDAGEILFPKSLGESIIDTKVIFLAVFYLDRRYYRMCKLLLIICGKSRFIWLTLQTSY